MSQEDVDVVLRSFEAWNGWDIEDLRGIHADDVVISTAMTELGRTFDSDDRIGDWVAELRETWAEIRYDLERIFEGNGVVVTFYRAVGTGRHSGIEVVHDFTGVYRVRDGLIASESVYLDRGEA